MSATVRFTLAFLATAAVLLTGSLLIPAVPAAAQESGRSVTGQRYDVDLQVQQGGDVLVRETIQIAFQGGEFSRGSRRIPLARLEGVTDVRVEQTAPEAVVLRRAGGSPEQPYTFAVSGEAQAGGPGSGDVEVAWTFPRTANAARTFVISYRARGAVRFYDGGDQLYWDVTGDDRPYPVRSSTVSLRLPAGVTVPAGQWRTDAYSQRFLRNTAIGTDGSVTWQIADVPAGETFEVRAQWPHGLVTGSAPSWQRAADEQDRLAQTLGPAFRLFAGVGAVAVLLGGGLWLLVTWYTRGRDPAVGTVAPELDSLPSELPPALVGTVVDEHADAQDVTATVLDLAARGEIAIRDVGPRDGAPAAGGRHDFELELLHDRKAIDARVRPYERLVLDSFFTRGPRVRLSELGGWWQFAVPRVEAALHEEVRAAGLFHDDPERIRRRYLSWGTILAVAGLLLGAVSCGVAPAYADPVTWPFLALGVVGLLILLVAPRMPKRTAAGALEAARWRAYGRYLLRQSAERIAPPSIAPDAPAASVENGERGSTATSAPGNGVARQGLTFERTLPYAVALGHGKEWVGKFSAAGTPAPRWLEPPVVVVSGGGWGSPMGPMGPYGPYGRRGRRGRWGRRAPGWGVPGLPGYPGYPGYPGGPAQWPGGRDGGAAPGGGSNGDGGGGGGPQGWSDSTAGGLERASGSLADLLDAASDVLSRGGSGGWSGGGRGGGSWSSGGGGSGGGGSSFS